MSMRELPALLGIAAALGVGVISPGPSFAMVALGLKLVTTAHRT